MREYYLSIRDHRLCVCEWGSEDGSPIVCLHGIRDQGAVWEMVAGCLIRQGFRVIAPDIRGHGRSSHGEKGTLLNLIELLADLDVMMKQLTDSPIMLVGHSMGAILAAMYAATQVSQVAHLVLIEPVLPPKANNDDILEQISTQLNYLTSQPQHAVISDLGTAAELLCQGTPGLSHEFAKKLASRITVCSEHGIQWRWDPILRSLYGIAFNGTKDQFLALLTKLHAPVTAIYAQSGRFNSEQDLLDLKEALPNATHLTIPGGHNLHLEAAEVVCSYIMRREEIDSIYKAGNHMLALPTVV